MKSRRDVLQQARRERRRRSTRKRLWALAGVLLFLIGVIVASHYTLLINDVVVEGNKVVAGKDIATRVQAELEGSYLYFIWPRHSVVAYPAETVVRNLLAAFPRLGSVDLFIRDLNTLVVRVSERKGVALWCPQPAGEPSCLFADDQGLIFAPAPLFSRNIYLEVTGPFDGREVGKQVLPPTEFASVLRFVDGVGEVLKSSALAGAEVRRLALGSDGEYRLTVALPESGVDFAILFSRRANADTSVANLRAALATPTLIRELAQGDQRLEYLDVRFDTKVFYKFAPIPTP